MSIEILDKGLCTGCMACKNICPVEAIKFSYNEKGFLYPNIDKEKCIECGLCEKTCPMLNKEERETPHQEIYAAKNKDLEVRMESSSGGLFHELSSVVLDNKGYICGAVYDEDFLASHVITNEKEIREKIQTSKYLQSSINDIYKEVENKLKDSNEVLFSGTPCQVDGLYKYLKTKGISTEKLITCDIICHGVPSPQIYEKYLKDLEEKYNSKITSVNFRHKENDYTQNIKVEFENGENYVSNYFEKDYFYNLFLRDYILRDSCYKCNYANMNRVSDITLGDFWGIEKLDEQFDDKKGVSLVIINSEKGKEIFNKIKEKFILLEVTDKEKCMQHNLKRPVDVPEEYDYVWKKYFEEGFKGLKDFINNL